MAGLDGDEVAEFLRLIHDLGDCDGALRWIRGKGVGKLESVKLLYKEAGVGLSEAKRLVHGSSAWGDVRQRDEALHETLWTQFEALEDDADPL